MADLRLAQITEEEIDPYTIDANSQIVEKIQKLERLRRQRESKDQIIETMMKKIVDSHIDEGQKLSIKEISNLFLECGFELSKIQLNELYLLMDAGRNFN